MRIRFFNTYEPVTTFYRDLTPLLAAWGHEIEIVISTAQYRQGRVLDDVFASVPTVRLSKIFSPATKAEGKLRKVLTMLAYALCAGFRSLFGRTADLNVFLTQPPLFLLWGLVLSRLRSQPYVCVIQDLYPHQMIAHGIFRSDSLMARILFQCSSRALRQAEKVIVIGRCMAEHVKAMGVAEEHVLHIPNWADETLVYPVPHDENSLRKAWSLTGKFVISYTGNVGMSHDVSDLIEVAERFRNRDEFEFVFLGDGMRLDALQTEVARLKLGNISFHPFQDLNLWAESYALGDVHFISYRDEHTGFGVPSRAYCIMAAGRPIIYQGSIEGEIARVVSEENIGHVIASGDVDALEEAILWYYETPQLLAECGLRAHQLIETKYSRQSMVSRYAEVLISAT